MVLKIRARVIIIHVGTYMYVLKPETKQNLLADFSFYSGLLVVCFHSSLLAVSFYLLVRVVLYSISPFLISTHPTETVTIMEICHC